MRTGCGQKVDETTRWRIADDRPLRERMTREEEGDRGDTVLAAAWPGVACRRREATTGDSVAAGGAGVRNRFAGSLTSTTLG